MTRLAYLSTDPGIAFGATKGAAVHIEELVTALAAEGAEVLLLVQGVTPDAPSPAGVEVERLPGPGKGAGTEERLAAEAQRARWIERRLRAFGADVLMERVALHTAAGAAAARALRIPHLAELNAPLPGEAAAYRRLDRPDEAHRLERATLASASLVLAVSEPLAAYARRRGAGRVEVLPNAVALERFPEPAARARADGVRAVFCGGLRPWHGVEVIAEAWRLLGPAAPPLLVVGDGPGRPRLEGMGAEMVGALPHDQVPAALARATIGLAPYSKDAPAYFSPLKLFEYLAAGLAIVAADLPGVAAVVDPESALLVRPGDARALAAAVDRLTAEPDLRRSLGRAARAVATRHTWADRAQRILAAASADIPAPPVAVGAHG